MAISAWREYLQAKEEPMSPTQIVVTVLVILVVAAIAAAVVVAGRRRALRQRFGPEYDHVVAEQESRSAAERELRDRERRHAELELVPLTPESRARYAEAWEELQVRFIDSPPKPSVRQTNWSAG
ncbi:hypothetical protein GCM10029963_60790 [Micromonospora andamanensis]